MPIFRELRAWAAFVVLAVASLLAVTITTEWTGFWDYAIAIGRRVEPLWVSAAILVYTVAEGADMLAEAFKKKLRAKYRAEGDASKEAAVQEAAKRQGMKPEDIQRVIDEARVIVRNGRSD